MRPGAPAELSYDESINEIVTRALQRHEANWHDMKLSQNIDELWVDTFFYYPATDDGTGNMRAPPPCPLFHKYGNPLYIGGGSYGMVLQYFKQFAPDRRSEQYAVKIQRIAPAQLRDTTCAAYVELRMLHEVNKLIDHWPNLGVGKRFSLFNVVWLHDWVMCQFSAKKVFEPLLSRTDRVKAKDYLTDDESSVNQIFVMELCEQGSVDSFMRLNDTTFDIVMGSKGFAGMMIQIFGTMMALGTAIDFSHHDLKPGNVLIHEPPMLVCPIRYLVYIGHNSGTLYLPTQDTQRTVYKLADFGWSSAQGPAWPHLLYSSAYRHSQVHSPAADLELYAVMLISSALHFLNENRVYGLAQRVHRKTIALLLACIHANADEAVVNGGERNSAVYGHEFSSADRNAAYTYLDLKGYLQWCLTGDPDELPGAMHDMAIRASNKSLSEETRRRAGRMLDEAARQSCHNIYRTARHTWVWRKERAIHDTAAFERFFALKAFDQYRTMPADCTQLNSHVANDFRVQM